MIFHLGVGTLIMPLISLALFAGITAYDMQKSLQLYNYASSNPEMLEKLSILEDQEIDLMDRSLRISIGLN